MLNMLVNTGIIDKYCKNPSLIPASLAVLAFATKSVASAGIISDDVKHMIKPIIRLFGDTVKFNLLNDSK